MPELNGLDLLRHAREVHTNLPIIFLSKNEDATSLWASPWERMTMWENPSQQLLMFRVKSVLRRHAPAQPVIEKPIEVVT